jgi:hypothetical protein
MHNSLPLPLCNHAEDENQVLAALSKWSPETTEKNGMFEFQKRINNNWRISMSFQKTPPGFTRGNFRIAYRQATLTPTISPGACCMGIGGSQRQATRFSWAMVSHQLEPKAMDVLVALCAMPAPSSMPRNC